MSALNKLTERMVSYSDELIDEFIQNVQKENGVILNKEKAIEALDNLSGLFLAFSKQTKSNEQ